MDFALGEGARLATRPFLSRLAAAGVRVHLLYLTVPDAVLDQRCAQRGTTQNYSWRKGALTRAHNLALWAQQTEEVHLMKFDHPMTTSGDLADWLCERGGMDFLRPPVPKAVR